MVLAGRGYRMKARRLLIRALKTLLPQGLLYNTPRRHCDFFSWLTRPNAEGSLIVLKQEEQREEAAPIIFKHHISARFSKYYKRKIPPAYIVCLRKGMVFGSQTNIIVSSSGILSSDLSREFGAYGGRKPRNLSFYAERVKLPFVRSVSGKMAVVTTQGCLNFHHWLYDSLPRWQLIKEAGLLNEMDFFLISQKGLSFQKESLQLLGVPEYKIINQIDSGEGIQADELYIPSLPSALGTVSPWVVDFLRKLFNPQDEALSGYERIFISRKNVKTRHVINEEALTRLFSCFGIREVYPEDYSVSEFAKIINGAKFIISVHGSGLSNLCFMQEGSLVIDILAPYHQDGYYWQITNICKGRYIGFFAEGEHPRDSLDLVATKIDDDLILDIASLEAIMETHLSRV